MKGGEFGQRRESKTELTPGPGSYENHTCTEIVNNSNPKMDMKGRSPRKTQKPDPENGPGSYKYYNVGKSGKSCDFGYRREIKTDNNPGPGSYDHHKRTEMANNSAPKWCFDAQASRHETRCDSEGGPGSYNDPRYFGNQAKGLEFGFRREIKGQDFPGPGFYEPHNRSELIHSHSVCQYDLCKKLAQSVLSSPQRSPAKKVNPLTGKQVHMTKSFVVDRSSPMKRKTKK